MEKSRLLDKLIEKKRKEEIRRKGFRFLLVRCHQCLFGTDFYPSAISQTSSLTLLFLPVRTLFSWLYCVHVQYTVYEQSHLRHFVIHFSTFMWIKCNYFILGVPDPESCFFFFFFFLKYLWTFLTDSF